MTCFKNVISFIFTLPLVCGISKKREALSLLNTDIQGKTFMKFPPYSDDNDTIVIGIAFSPVGILELNAVDQVLSTRSFAMLIWSDPDLMWDASTTSNQSVIELDPETIWTPRIALYNSMKTVQPLTSRNKIALYSNGELQWHLTDIFHVSCKFDVTYYPFDTQRCKVIFLPLVGYEKIQLHVLNFSITDDTVTDTNGEWRLKSTTYRLVETQFRGLVAATFELTLERKEKFYILNIIFPMALLSILNPLVFLIPARSGERIGYIMAVFVSQALFLNLIHQFLPPTSDSVPKLAIFLAILEVQAFVTILGTVAALCAYHKLESENSSKTPIPKEMGKNDERDSLVSVNFGTRRGTLVRVLDGLFFVFSLMFSVASSIVWAFC